MPINFHALGAIHSPGTIAQEPYITDAIQYVSNNIFASDSNDGFSEGSAKSTISSALTSLPLDSDNKPYGVIYVLPSSSAYSLPETVNMGRFTSIIGAGSGLVTITANPSGESIRWEASGAAFHVGQSGILKGFTLVGSSSPSAVGVHIGDITGNCFDDVVFKDFTAGTALWMDNTTHWTERIVLIRTVFDNNKTGIKMTVNGGTNSFGYQRWLDTRFTINTGQVGIQMEDVCYSYNTLYTVLANIADNGTLFKLVDTASIDHGMFVVTAEQTSGTGGIAANISSGASVSGWGMFRTGGMAITNSNPAGFSHTFRILSPEALVNSIPTVQDGGVIANFLGSGVGGTVVPQLVYGIDNPFGYGMISGTNIISPYVAMFDFGGRNGFIVYKHGGSGAGSLAAGLVEIFRVNTDGSVKINQHSSVSSNSGIPNNSNGLDGDYYFRDDGGGAGATHLYYKNAGVWVGIA